MPFGDIEKNQPILYLRVMVTDENWEKVVYICSSSIWQEEEFKSYILCRVFCLPTYVFIQMLGYFFLIQIGNGILTIITLFD